MIYIMAVKKLIKRNLLKRNPRNSLKRNLLKRNPKNSLKRNLLKRNPKNSLKRNPLKRNPRNPLQKNTKDQGVVFILLERVVRFISEVKTHKNNISYNY